MTTRIYTTNIKDSTDAYLAYAIIDYYPDGHIEYCAEILDGSRPAPYLDKETLQLVMPRSRDKTIICPAGSWADALAQLQALADEYGTLPGGAPAVKLKFTANDLRND